MSKNTRTMNVDTRVTTLVATVAAAADLADSKAWQQRERDADALFTALFGRAQVFLPNEHKPPSNSAIGLAQWGPWTYQQIGATGLGEQVYDVAPWLREIAVGPPRNYRYFEQGSAERAKYVEQDKRGDDRGGIRWTPLLTGMTLAKKIQREFARDNEKWVKYLARQIKAGDQRRKRDVERSQRDLVRWLDQSQQAMRRAEAAAIERGRKAASASPRQVLLVAAEQAAGANARSRARLEAARKAYQPPEMTPTEAWERLSGRVAHLRGVLATATGMSSAESQRIRTEFARANKVMAAFEQFVDKGTKTWRDHGTRPMVGFMAYLARETRSGSEQEAGWAAAEKTWYSARANASVAVRKANIAERDGLLMDDATWQAENPTTPDGRSWKEIVAPAVTRRQAHLAVRQAAVEAGTAKPAYAPKNGNVESSLIEDAKSLQKLALDQHMEYACDVLRTRSSAVEVKHQTPLPVLSHDTGPGAQLASVSEGLNLNSPAEFARSFMTGLPPPRQSFARLCGGYEKKSWHRFQHLVLSMPEGMNPEHYTNEALVGAMGMRMRLVGLDPKHHRNVMFVHRDKTHVHIHCFVDRIRDDGRLWGANHIDRSHAANAASALGAALFLRRHGESSAKPNFEPIIHGNANMLSRDFVALRRLASEKLRCNLTWQNANDDGDYDYNSPYHGGQSDESDDNARDLFDYKAIREALTLSGHVGFLPGFFKIDDDAKQSPSDLLLHERTNHDPESWRCEAGDRRAIRFFEHLFKRLYSAQAA